MKEFDCSTLDLGAPTGMASDDSQINDACASNTTAINWMDFRKMASLFVLLQAPRSREAPTVLR
jgi:hypothetical protein